MQVLIEVTDTDKERKKVKEIVINGSSKLKTDSLNQLISSVRPTVRYAFELAQ